MCPLKKVDRCCFVVSYNFGRFLLNSVEISGFSAIQILREISFGESKSAKIAVFALFWGFEFG